MEDITKYYKQGQEAFSARKPITYNPYPHSMWNAHHLLWRRGWTDACNEEKNPKKTVKFVDKSIDIF